MPPQRFSPSDEILSGKTADVYFHHTLSVLEHESLDPETVMEFFPGRSGILCGTEEVKALLENVLLTTGSEVWMLDEGTPMTEKEVVLRIKAPYKTYGLYETAIDGILAHSSGWATAARECVTAANSIPVFSFGARHIHPNVATVMDYAAIIGGCTGCSTSGGAELAGLNPSGTMPHALILILGDTVVATVAFDKHIDSSIPRVSLVDTFTDEATESVRVANALKEKLISVRLDTPRELGGVTPDLVRNVRNALDSSGFNHVGIFVSGGMTPERIAGFIAAQSPIAGFGVGSYISGASPIDFTADLHEINGKPVAKRGRKPGITASPRLNRIMYS